jgi:hypothetical protein
MTNCRRHFHPVRVKWRMPWLATVHDGATAMHKGTATQHVSQTCLIYTPHGSSLRVCRVVAGPCLAEDGAGKRARC